MAINKTIYDRIVGGSGELFRQRLEAQLVRTSIYLRNLIPSNDPDPSKRLRREWATKVLKDSATELHSCLPFVAGDPNAGNADPDTTDGDTAMDAIVAANLDTFAGVTG